MTNANHIGQPHARIDGRAKVSGRAQYAADFNQPGQAYAVIVGASIGLGQVVEVNAEAARRLPGGLAILTHENAPALAYAPHKGFIDPAHGDRLHVLQDDRVRFYGQPVAVVVAQTPDQAEHATCLLQIRYAGETPVCDPLDNRAEAVVPEAGREPDPIRPPGYAATPMARWRRPRSVSMPPTMPRARITSRSSRTPPLRSSRRMVRTDHLAGVDAHPDPEG
ncbi:hypothetical protein [Cupriavidus lacunae]|uniref:hypothetical protein n=1 Tax=Cupriavidus lacunae TaxID=2666307 RepID=UPI001FC92D6A|nr:hypothetical protein [Cupriavidus lacunae]